MSRRAAIVLLGLCSLLTAPGMVSAQTSPKPKLASSAIQIGMVEVGDIAIPAEFRFAVYEQLLTRVRASGAFQKVYRSGDRAADGIPDLVTLHTKVDAFKQGSQTTRELTTVFGATKVDVSASVTARDGRTLMDQKITGRVRFFGENLGVTNDLAKRITKLINQTF